MANNKKVILPKIENKELEEAIHALKEGSTPEKQAKLSEELKKAKLLSPCSFEITPDKDGKPRLHADQVKFFLLNTNDGKTFFPVFTNFEETKKITFGEDQPKDLVRTINDLGKMLAGKNNKAEGIIINPGSDNIVIPRNLVLLLAGILKVTPKKPAPANNAAARVTYSEPRVYPTKMVTALYDVCAKDKRIDRVWLKQKLTGMAISFVLIVSADEKDEAIFNTLQETALPLSKDVPIECMWYDEKVEKDIVKASVAFYDRNLEL